MKYKKRNIILCLLICIICFSSSITALAATHYLLTGKGYSTASIKINSDAVSSQYTYRLDDAIDAWNNSGADVDITISKYSGNTIKTKTLANETFYGEYAWNYIHVVPFTGRVRQFDITINLATCTSKEMQSTMVHELGHALNLDDNPCNTTSDKDKSVMNYGRDRTVTKKPTSWDIEGVKASY